VRVEMEVEVGVEVEVEKLGSVDEAIYPESSAVCFPSDDWNVFG